MAVKKMTETEFKKGDSLVGYLYNVNLKRYVTEHSGRELSMKSESTPDAVQFRVKYLGDGKGVWLTAHDATLSFSWKAGPSYRCILKGKGEPIKFVAWDGFGFKIMAMSDSTYVGTLPNWGQYDPYVVKGTMNQRFEFHLV